MGSPDKACSYAKKAFDAAIADIHTLNAQEYQGWLKGRKEGVGGRGLLERLGRGGYLLVGWVLGVMRGLQHSFTNGFDVEFWIIQEKFKFLDYFQSLLHIFLYRNCTGVECYQR